ncbi:hypothetical protein ACFQ0T_07935 [Kitasatospora gansuensis]
MLMEKVAEILAETSAEVVEPRFRALAAGEVIEKAPGRSSRSPTGRPR